MRMDCFQGDGKCKKNKIAHRFQTNNKNPDLKNIASDFCVILCENEMQILWE